MLSPGEVKFIKGGVLDDIRVDGRARLDFRPLQIETGLLPQTNGSARVVLDGTDVLVGVKAELGIPSIESPDVGRVEATVECCPSASPEYEGRGGSSLNLELGRMLERSLSLPSVLDLKSLCLIPSKQCWVIYIDALVLDSTGNLIDALSIAARAALSNVKIPLVKVIGKENDFELELDQESSFSFNVSTIPVSVTFTLIGSHYVVDATLEEEACSDCTITYFVFPNGNIALIKSGHGSVRREIFQNITADASAVAKYIAENMERILDSENKRTTVSIGFL